VDPQLSLTPAGLTNNQLDRLTAYAKRASKLALEDLQEVARRHLQDTIAAHQHNPFVNLRLAQALCDTIQQLATNWHTLRPEARFWLSGAILYFAKSDDDEPDFTSPIGFEDDAEVLNACLRLARLDDLCLHPEDYDDVE
jgi:uncharacterized membrane protein YkvA (DUF1232 family)